MGQFAAVIVPQYCGAPAEKPVVLEWAIALEALEMAEQSQPFPGRPPMGWMETWGVPSAPGLAFKLKCIHFMPGLLSTEIPKRKERNSSSCVGTSPPGFSLFANVFIKTFFFFIVFYCSSQITFLLCFGPSNFFPSITSWSSCSPPELPSPSSKGHKLPFFFYWVPALCSARLVFFPAGSSFGTWARPMKTKTYFSAADLVL